MQTPISMLSSLLRLASVVAVLALAACATPQQAPVPLTESSFQSNSRLGIAMTPLPEVDTHLPGAGCLLCIAVASAANSSLTTHSKTLPRDDLKGLPQQAADLAKKRGGDVIVLGDPLDLKTLADFGAKGENIARKDFTRLRDTHKIDRILVIEVSMLGMLRPYSGYVPVSEPKAVLRGRSYIVNLKTNSYEWYQPVNVQKSAEGGWDEPPKFPGLTNAYFQAIELGKDELLGALAK